MHGYLMQSPFLSSEEYPLDMDFYRGAFYFDLGYEPIVAYEDLEGTWIGRFLVVQIEKCQQNRG